MSWDKLFRWVFFCAGIITIIFAGYMFYIGNTAGGAAWLAMSVGFLCFATRIHIEKSDPAKEAQANKDLHDLAILIADIAISGMQNIGRTAPPGTKEIQELEEKVNNFLEAMPLDEHEREEISDRFDTLRNRTRRNDGGRAIMRSSRL